MNIDRINMILNNKLNEVNSIAMTPTELVKAGVNHVTGYGGVEIPVNSHGFLIDPASKFSLLDKFKDLWSSSGGDVNKFMGMQVNGTSVHDIFSQMPSQQAYGVGNAIGLPSGTNVPAATWGSGHWSAIKLGTGNTPIPPTDGGASAAIASGSALPPDGGVSASAAIASWPIPITPEIAISALIIGGGIYAAIKALGNTIKSRFRKCAKVLWNMQKDFVSEDGLDMKKVLPGVGNWFTDLWAKIFYGPKSDQSDNITGSANSGAIGVQPFIRRYFAEITHDYHSAVNAFNSIAIAGRVKSSNESVGKFNSFREALLSKINEGTENDTSRTSFNNKINPKNIYNNGGNLCYKNGSTEVKINVTKESTREVASAIMAMFLNKYTNADKIYKKLGIDTLGEIDSKNIENFTKVINMYKGDILREKEGNGAKLYGRMREAYNKMIDAYISIGNRVIKNFEKYTKNKKGEANKSNIDQKGLSEKDDNLLFASVKKLDAKWDQQKDYFKNNFDKIVLAVVQSKDYQAYINFIIEKVLPIFKTGEAGNADIVLDITPKKGEKYIIRQTRDDSTTKSGLTLSGNVAIAEIENFNFKKQEITFKLYGKINNPRAIKVSGKNKAAYSVELDNIDTDAYAGREPITMSYHAFMSLDPEQLEHDNDYYNASKDNNEIYVYDLDLDGAKYKIIAQGEITSVNKQENTSTNASEQPENASENSSYEPDTNINEDGDDNSDKDYKNIIIKTILLCRNNDSQNNNIDQNVIKVINVDDDNFNKTTLETKLHQAYGNSIKRDDSNNPPIALQNIIKYGNGDNAVTINDATNVGDDIRQSIKNDQEQINNDNTKRANISSSLSGAISTLLSSLTLIKNNNNFSIDSSTTAETFKQFNNNTNSNNVKQPNFIKLSNNDTYSIITNTVSVKSDNTNKCLHLNISCNNNTLLLSEPTLKINNIKLFEIKSSNTELLNKEQHDSLEQNKTINGESQSQQGSNSNNDSNVNNNIANVEQSESFVINTSSNINTLNESIANVKELFDAVKENIHTIFNRLKQGNSENQQIQLYKLTDDIITEFSTKATDYIITQSISILVDNTSATEEQLGTITESIKDDFQITYDITLNESLSDTVKITRHVTASNTYNDYYLISKTGWSDGTHYDTVKYLKESLIQLCKNRAYDDIVKAIKNDRSFKISKVNENISYEPIQPLNSYGMNTSGNNLYEAIQLVHFNKKGFLDYNTYLNTYKVSK